MKGISFSDYAGQDSIARNIADYYIAWESARSVWLSQTTELRNYLFATSTRTTSANTLPWKNSVHIPKLCQIRDNLYANYMAALFPNDKVLSWEGDDQESQTKEKRKIIQAYMANKLRQSGFIHEFSKCVLDWIDYGNCFAMVTYKESKTVDDNGTTATNYSGPVFHRLSPLDIVFDPKSPTFEESPKIIRQLRTLGDLKREMEENPENGYLEEVFSKAMQLRVNFRMGAPPDVRKNTYYAMDGFSSYWDYMKTDTVELLHFYGDIYDTDTETLHMNRVITVIDRAYVIRNIAQPSWLGRAPIFHCGWRTRPDNLYAMGPLDNLVGMQYRIDHLENAKADAFDLFIHPVLKIRGFVEDFDYGPNQRIYVGDDGDVEFMHPDHSVLQADTQIAIYEAKMEEMAGAPRQAAGHRTPGEKTAFEVQILDQSANKIFINKTSYLEEIFFEPAINSMLEVSRRSIPVVETIRVEDEDFNFIEFLKVTRQDLTVKGKIRPIGARKYARNSNLLQSLAQFSSSPLGQDPSVMAHFSGKKMAELVEELLGIQHYNMVRDNIRVIESIETQQVQSSGMSVMQQQGQMPNQIPGGPPPRQGSAPAVATVA